MKYYDLLEIIESGKVKELQKTLLQGKKNATIKMYRDYYIGKQWIYKGWLTDTTRSGKKVWNIHRESPNDLGIGEGDLQVYNVCDATINIYSSYGRGSIHDDNRINIEKNDKLSDFANDNINLDVLISRTLTRGGVDSITTWKFNEDKSLDVIDSLETFPVYDGEDKVGTVRIYEISKNDPLIKERNIKINKNETAIYMEVWYPQGDIMWLRKYVNDQEIEEGKAPFNFDPHIYVANKDNEFVRFDENNTEISDIGRLIDVQDALNKTITEEGIIISKVAFPMIKVIKEIYDKMATGEIDAEKLKKDLSNITLVAGKIISAPIEREQGIDMPSGIDTYVDNIFQQIHRITGIPKGVFVSEGMSGISEKTMSAMMESLKRRVDEKRANIEKGIKEYVAMLVENQDIKDDVNIEWAEIFGMSKEEQAELIIKSFQSQIITRDYSVEKILEILGDGEKFDEIMAQINSNDFNKKLETEKEKLKADNERIVKSKDELLNKEREQRLKSETDKALLSKEIENITSSI